MATDSLSLKASCGASQSHPGSTRTPCFDIARRVERFTFDRVYGGWWGRAVVHDGASATRRSTDRYVARLHGERPTDATA